VRLASVPRPLGSSQECGRKFPRYRRHCTWLIRRIHQHRNRPGSTIKDRPRGRWSAPSSAGRKMGPFVDLRSRDLSAVDGEESMCSWILTEQDVVDDEREAGQASSRLTIIANHPSSLIQTMTPYRQGAQVAKKITHPMVFGNENKKGTRMIVLLRSEDWCMRWVGFPRPLPASHSPRFCSIQRLSLARVP
jgi:hypothetical protein